MSLYQSLNFESLTGVFLSRSVFPQKTELSRRTCPRESVGRESPQNHPQNSNRNSTSDTPKSWRRPARVVMLASGTGTTVSAFCKAGEKGQLPAQVVAVVTNENKAGVISIAKEHQIPCTVIKYQKDNSKDWDQHLLRVLKKQDPDLILLAGFLKKIGPAVLSHFKNQILNSHPALLPEFSGKGMYGLRVHSAVIAQKKTETGVTIHLVNENYDEGRILAQKKLSVLPKETPAELEKRVKTMEKELYIQTVTKIIHGDISLI